MRPFIFRKKSQPATEEQSNIEPIIATESQAGEVVTTATKVKIVLALLVVGFATYVAYWVQQPTDIRTDVINPPAEDISQQTDQQNPDPDPKTPAAPAVPAAPSETPKADSQVALNSNADGNNADGNNAQTPSAPPPVAEKPKKEISIINFKFDPPTLQLEKGTMVQWTNKDTMPHTVTADSFQSPNLNPGESFTYTFTNDGSFEYHCSFHPNMKGLVAVGTAAGIPADTMTAPVQQINNVLDQVNAITNGAAPVLPMPPLPPAFMINAAAPQVHGAPYEPLSMTAAKVVKSTRLPSSGPEDYLYGAAIALILFFNRKRLSATHEKC